MISFTYKYSRKGGETHEKFDWPQTLEDFADALVCLADFRRGYNL